MLAEKYGMELSRISRLVRGDTYATYPGPLTKLEDGVASGVCIRGHSWAVFGYKHPKTRHRKCRECQRLRERDLRRASKASP